MSKSNCRYPFAIQQIRGWTDSDRFPFKAVPGEMVSVEYPGLRIVNHVTGVFHERRGCGSRRR